jgi:anhydro-N-acetylmuramic acid kinase
VIIVSAASGTSADGLDLAVVELALSEDDVLELDVLTSRTAAWPGDLRDAILATLPPAQTTMAAACDLDQRIGQATADAVAVLLTESGQHADLVVAPGQTVFHDVRDGHAHGTLQLGQPAWIAERTGLPVVSDLRSRDVAAGGQGAPLASTLDALWLAGPGGPRAALNLGGIANVTLVGEAAEPLLAWDTGPANCLLDVAAERLTGGVQQHDEDGRMARAGDVRSDLLDVLLAHPHFARRPPASTGREAFSAAYLDRALLAVEPVAPNDLMATLTELTALTVANALAPQVVTEVVGSGGGVRNPALMDALSRRLAPTTLVRSEQWGLPADTKEAVMWALLGFLTWHGIPGATAATGASRPRILGRISPGSEPLTLPSPRPVRVRGLHLAGVASEGRPT